MKMQTVLKILATPLPMHHGTTRMRHAMLPMHHAVLPMPHVHAPQAAMPCSPCTMRMPCRHVQRGPTMDQQWRSEIWRGPSVYRGSAVWQHYAGGDGLDARVRWRMSMDPHAMRRKWNCGVCCIVGKQSGRGRPPLAPRGTQTGGQYRESASFVGRWRIPGRWGEVTVRRSRYDMMCVVWSDDHHMV